jgi:glycoside/pentoside/hexuronide:cation symporter, GPH family
MKQIKKWQEPFYAIGGFGPGFLYQIALTYLIYFYRPAQALIQNKGALVFAPAAGFAAGMLVARILDGLVDIPIASWTDNMKSKWGRRRPLMLLGMIPAAVAFILMWYPPFAVGVDGSTGNAVYIAIMSSVFFFFYTLMTVPYLASLSELVKDETSRVRVASWQTFFNTASYVLVYVVAPILFDKFGVRGTVWLLLPCIVSFIGPLLVIKEESTLRKGENGETIAPTPAEVDVPIWQSFKMTLTNRTFGIYVLSLATFFFGLQFFLGGVSYMALDMMGLTQTQLGYMNAAAFAPVPIMLLLFNFIARKKGAKLGFQIALIVFAVVMMLFPLAWTKLNMPLSPMLIGIILGGIGSFSVGVFFTIPYAFPSQIAAEEAAVTGKNRAGMFFAVQGLINQFVGSLAGSVLVLLLDWKYGVLLIGPIAGLACIVSFFFIRPYPLGKPAAKTS